MSARPALKPVEGRPRNTRLPQTPAQPRTDTPAFHSVPTISATVQNGSRSWQSSQEHKVKCLYNLR